MTWQPWLLAACSISVAALGWVTYRRGRRNDDKLDVAANIQATFDTQTEINTALREDVVRLHAAHQRCEEATNDLRRANADLHLERDKQDREIARLKAVVNEHEMAIASHERTINMLKAARRER